MSKFKTLKIEIKSSKECEKNACFDVMCKYFVAETLVEVNMLAM